MASRIGRCWWACAAIALADCGSPETCATYLCVDRVKLVGSISLPAELEQVDATFCDATECRTELVPVGSGDGACSELAEGVCLNRHGDRVDLSASWSYAETSGPKDLSYRIRLTDPMSGQTLLDETRTAKATITREDTCHTCWTADAEL